MDRPKFTRDEEKLIAFIRIRTEDRVSVLLAYGPWLGIPTVLFFFGLFHHDVGYMTTGFLIELAIAIRFVYYQLKPGWRIRPVIEKYESCFEEPEGRPKGPPDR